jgi:hypothetical protein
MQGSELFGVVVRSAGLYCTLRGLWSLTYAIKLLAGICSNEKYPIKEWLLSAVTFCGTGVFLLLAADSLVRALYR